MKVDIVAISQSSRRDKYTNMEWQQYRTPKPYKTAKNIKDYQKGFIHLGKLHRIHNQRNPEAGVSIYQAEQWKIILLAEGSSPTASKYRGEDDIQEAVSGCMWLGGRGSMVWCPFRQVGQGVRGPR